MDFIVSISWAELFISVGAGAIYYFLARMYLKQSVQKGAVSAVVLFGMALVFRVVHIFFAHYFTQPWPFDLRDEHTAFLVAAPLLSGALTRLTGRCSALQILGVVTFSLILNTAFFLCVGFALFALH